MSKNKIFNVMLSKGLGGIEQAFLNYNKALSKSNDIIPIISNACKIKHEINCDYESINVLNKYDPFAILNMRKLIRKHKPSLIIAHSTMAYVICKFSTKNIPIIAVAHNYTFKHILSAKYIFVLTSHMKNELKKLYNGDISIIPNMIEVCKDEYKSRRFRPIVTIGFIGALTYNKGVDLLLEAASYLIKDNPKIRIEIAGIGDELYNLKVQANKLNIESNVHFLGWIGEDQKNKFFEKIDLLCAPSRIESFGIVFLEAMKYNKPIVTTNTHGGLSVAADAGIVCEIDNAKSLQSGLEKVISDKTLAKKMIDKGTECVKEFSFEVVSKKMQKVINSILIK